MEADQFITTITDKEGVRYPMNCHIEGLLHCFRVCCGGVLVAEAQCWLAANDELQLNDLRVVDSALIPWLKLPLLGAVGLVRWRSFRRKGLSTALLAEVVQWSRLKGLQRITGKVVAADLNAFPGLPAMYQRAGFELHPGSGNTSYCIEMKLKG